MAKILDLKLISAIMLTKLVYTKMKEKHSERIVKVSSLSGIRSTYGNSTYAASKFALYAFMQPIAIEAKRRRMKLTGNVVCPGYLETKMDIDAIKRRAQRNWIDL